MAIFDAEWFDGALVGHYPALGTLVEQCKLSPDFSLFDSSELLSQFFSTSFASDFVESELRKIEKNDEYSPADTDHGIELIRFPVFSIWMGKLNTVFSRDLFRTENSPFSSETIATCANDIICCNKGPAELVVELYETPKHQDDEVFDRSLRPELVGSRVIRGGELLHLRAGRDLLKIRDNDRSIQMYAVSHECAPLVRHYHYPDLTPLYCCASDGKSSSIQQSIELLVRLGAREALPEIKSAYGSEYHFVRWTAVKAVLALDEVEGLELVRMALNDEHPHVRVAAAKTLEIMNSLPST